MGGGDTSCSMSMSTATVLRAEANTAQWFGLGEKSGRDTDSQVKTGPIQFVRVGSSLKQDDHLLDTALLRNIESFRINYTPLQFVE